MVDVLGRSVVNHGKMPDTTNTDRTSSIANSSRPGYAIGFLTDIAVNEDLRECTARLESTMSSLGGYWLVPGSPPEVCEGPWMDEMIIIAFPDLARARAWYESKAYQDLARLRTKNSTSWIALVEGVAPDHAASSTIETFRATGDGIKEASHGFLPAGFEPPTSLVTEHFRLEPLGPQHNEADLGAWMSSIDHIRATPGYPDGNWPPPGGMTSERNMRDLRRHADDFASGKGFTFTVLDPVTTDVIGCVYLYPAQTPNHDVTAQSWVREDRADLDGFLAETIARWIETDWPWERVDYLDR